MGPVEVKCCRFKYFQTDGSTINEGVCRHKAVCSRKRAFTYRLKSDHLTFFTRLFPNLLVLFIILFMYSSQIRVSLVNEEYNQLLICEVSICGILSQIILPD